MRYTFLDVGQSLRAVLTYNFDCIVCFELLTVKDLTLTKAYYVCI